LAAFDDTLPPIADYGNAENNICSIQKPFDA